MLALSFQRIFLSSSVFITSRWFRCTHPLFSSDNSQQEQCQERVKIWW